MTALNWQGIKQSLGPGLMMAAAAIGVSHLVQSTRAGAEFGFALVWAVLLANLFKYPFLEFGPRYALATGKNMLEGYKKMSPWAFWIFIIFTIATMFAVHAAVTIVTGSLATNLIGIELSAQVWSAVILVLCVLLLINDRYSLLDHFIKLLMVILAISTVAALIVTISSGSVGFMSDVEPPEIWSVSGVAFLIALMGWMPIPLDASAWHSIWTNEKTKQTGYRPRFSEVQFDFNLGYLGAAIIALCFLTLGALVMFGTGQEFALSATLFSDQLIQLYTSSLGQWASFIIIICAFSTMLSTTLTITDTYPRVFKHAVLCFKPEMNRVNASRIFRVLLVLITSITLILLLLFGNHFRLIIDFATTISFLIAPILAFMNHKLIHQSEVAEEYRPGPWLYWLSISGILFLSGFALFYIYWMLFV